MYLHIAVLAVRLAVLVEGVHDVHFSAHSRVSVESEGEDNGGGLHSDTVTADAVELVVFYVVQIVDSLYSRYFHSTLDQAS